MKWPFLMVSGMSVLLVGCIRVAALPSGPEAREEPAEGEATVREPRVQVRGNGGAQRAVACEDAKEPHERAAACLPLAEYLDEGRFGVPRDPLRAAMLREDVIDALGGSCAHGAVEDCTRAAFVLGLTLRAAGPSDPGAREAGLWMESYAEDGCHGGDAAGCALLGVMYEQGQDVPRDVERSAAYYEQACRGGHRRTCLLLAERAEEPFALRAYERACDAGSGFACAAAGQRYRFGGGPAPSVDAVVYFARGCAMGDPAACVLGVETARSAAANDPRGPETTPRRVRLEPRSAASFAWTGCRQGIPDACLLLGEVFQRGEGVPRDEATARAAYRQACDAGLTKACEALRPARRASPGRPDSNDAPVD